MPTKATRKLRVMFILSLGMVAVLLAISLGVWGGSVAYAQSDQPPTPGPDTVITSDNETDITTTMPDGTSITANLIHGPPVPPPGFEADLAPVEVMPATAKILTVPAYTWLYGCSAVSGAMIAGYYDSHGYPKMYTGPTNGGVMPFTNVWGTWNDGSAVNPHVFPNNPLVASHQGVDGRTTKGSIDDYWKSYESTANDPFIGHWAQHAWGSAIGDYMKTSQSSYGNIDSSTAFYNYSNPKSAAKLTCAIMKQYGSYTRDGTYGRMLFYQSKGYTVTDCYNQMTSNQVAGGFSLAQFRAEINAGRPVMLNLVGHTVVGVGYDPLSAKIYIHDTWSATNQAMIWGGSYAGRALKSVSIVNLKSTAPVVAAPAPISPSGATTDRTPTYTWRKVTGATAYQYQLYKGTAFVYNKIVSASAFCGTTTCSNTYTTSFSLPLSTAYKWRVRAYKGAWGAYSAFKTFSINAPTTNIKPRAGFWRTPTLNQQFYVTANQAYVDNFALYVSACGHTWKITNPALLSIVSKKFSFGGAFNASGTFTTTTTATTRASLYRFPLCGGLATGGPFIGYNKWTNTSQPAMINTVGVQVDFVQELQNPYNSVIVTLEDK